MASKWTTKIERLRCRDCGWKATRAKPSRCPACRSVSVAVVDRRHTWKASYRDPSGRIRSRSFDRKLDADAWLDKVAVSVRERTYLDPDAGKELLGDVVREHVAKSPKLGPSTRHLYAEMAAHHIYPAPVAATPIRALTPADLQAFLDDARGRTGARTVEILRNIMSGALRRAVRNGSIMSNPCSRLELERPQRRPARFLTAAEAESIADSIDQRYRALVLVSAFGALRFGEAAGLRKRDVGLRKLRIHGSVVQVGSKVERVERTKTEDSLREVSVPASVMEELARHITELGVEDDDALLFPAPNGGPLSRTLFRSRVWVPACERAGLAVAERSPSGSFRGWKVRPPRFHDLRHTGVALAIKAGAHPRTIQTWVGHSSISTTMNIYGHLYDEAHEELASGLDAQRVAALASREVTDVVAIGSRPGHP